MKKMGRPTEPQTKGPVTERLAFRLPEEDAEFLRNYVEGRGGTISAYLRGYVRDLRLHRENKQNASGAADPYTTPPQEANSNGQQGN